MEGWSGLLWMGAVVAEKIGSEKEADGDGQDKQWQQYMAIA